MINSIFKTVLIFCVIIAILGLAACSKAGPASAPADKPGAPSVSTQTAPQVKQSPQTSGQAEPPPKAGLPIASPTIKPGAPASGPTSTAPVTKPGVFPQQPSSPSLIPASQGVRVRGSGTVSISTDSNLNFDTGGKIGRLYVKKGDLVKKGSLLATLDDTSLLASLAQAKVNLEQAKLTKTTAELAVENAKFTLDKTKAVTQIKDVITDLQWKIKIAELNGAQAATTDNSNSYWATLIYDYRRDLTAQTRFLTDLLNQSTFSGIDTYDIKGQKFDTLTQQDIRMKQLQIELAQQTVEKSVDGILQASRNLDLIQKQLDNASIFAPFDGMIATLNAKEGDVVSAPTPGAKPIIYMIDPTAMQVIVSVNELDIPQVKIGQKAVVKIDAFPNAKIDGKVTDISVFATLQGGVVSYDTTISFNVPPGMDIRSGMNATAEIVVSG